jgi:hypothetical protein
MITKKKKITKLRIRNHTDIPDELLREIIRFVQPSGVSGFDVRVSNLGTARGRSFGRGRAYTHGCHLHDRNCPFVVVSLGARHWFPMKESAIKGYLPFPWMASREEAAVYLLAHELRHLWQAKVPKGYRVWGARGQYSERDACAYAIRMLRAWRKA